MISISTFLILFGVLCLLTPYIVLPRSDEQDLDLALFFKNEGFEKILMLAAFVFSGIMFFSFGVILKVGGL